MDGERSRLPMISCERWGGKVYPDAVIAGGFPDRRVMMMSTNKHNTAITIDSFIHSCIQLTSRTY